MRAVVLSPLCAWLALTSVVAAPPKVPDKA